MHDYISYFPSLTSSKPEEISWETVASTIRGEFLRTKTEQYREARAESNHVLMKSIKTSCPGIVYNEDNFVMGFHGDPFSSHGGGCYAPGMVNTANRFFVQNSSPFRAIDITGTALNDLYYYLAVGAPVMLWSTIDLKPGIKCGSVIQYGDISYQWDKREHCVILSGYNLADNTVTIYDSISGIKTYNADQLKASYDSMWNMAMVIK